MELQVSDEVKNALLQYSYTPELGARELRRTIEQYVETPLALFFLTSPHLVTPLEELPSSPIQLQVMLDIKSEDTSEKVPPSVHFKEV